MKKILLYKTAFVLVVFILISGSINAQNYQQLKSLNKSIVVPDGIRISMKNKSGDLKINTSEENVVSIKTDIKVNGKSKEDVEMVIDAIENFKFDLNGNSLEIDTRFYKLMMNIGIRQTMTLLNGEKVRIKEVEVTHVLNIPKSALFELDNKYGDIEMQSHGGEVDLVLYNTKINAGDFGGNVKMAMKYSKAYMGNFKHADFDLYDSDVFVKKCGDVDVISKYSKFEADKANDLNINSYDDKYTILSAANLMVTAKYSDFIFNDVLNKFQINFYDSNAQFGEVQKGVYSGKYSEIKFDGISNFYASYSYDDKFEFGNAVNLKVDESKYSEYYINEVSSFLLAGYDDIVKIRSLAHNFEGPVSVSGKYVKLDVLAGTIPYQLDFKIKYPKIDIPENISISKRIERNSSLELIGNNSGGKIIVDGYNMTVKIK